MKKLNIKLLTVLSFVALAFMVSSCEDEDKFRFPELTNGGFVKFVYQPNFWEGIETFDNRDEIPNNEKFSVVYYHIGANAVESNFVAVTEDPNGNVANYELFVNVDLDGYNNNANPSIPFTGILETPVPFKSTTTFPFDVSFTSEEISTVLGIDVEDLVEGAVLEFTSRITTNDGRVYVPYASACVDCPEPTEDDFENEIVIPFEDPGAWNGGNIDGIVLQGGDETGANEILPAVHYRVKYEAPSE